MNEEEKILVVDDEKHIRRLVSDYLTHEGFSVDEAESGQIALEKIADRSYNLVLLDIRMPKMNGLETLQQLRKYSDVPVMFLTALDNERSEIQALNDGAVDYITKPFSFDLLIARITNFLKRNRPTELETYGKLSINRAKKQALVKGTLIDLTQKEFEILDYLCQNDARIFSRVLLLDRIWGISFYGDERTIDTHIKTLRKKLGSCGDYIKTKRGMGYYFEID